jgi:predicted TIM-barrel fold metal-dependent hydrolase
MLDVHAHAFNLRSLPVRGILKAKGLPSPLAAAVAALLLSLVQDDSEPRRASVSPPTMADEDQTEVLVQRIADATPSSIFLDEEFVAGLHYVDASILARGLVESRSIAEQPSVERVQAQIAAADDAAFVRIVRTFNLSQARVETRSWFVRWLLKKAISLVEKGVGLFRFLWILTDSEQNILKLYCETYPEVTFLVHHMMDLETHYGGDQPVYRYPVQQIPRMLRIAKDSPIPMLVFAAWDPYRDNCREIIENAVSLGCAGVKVYPPSGYRATENADGTYDGPPAAVIDQRNDWLYAFATGKNESGTSRDLPILTHCSPGGFEAKPGYGLFSNPKYWRRVLTKFPTLRVCLGHTGGGAGWFAPDDAGFQSSFAGEAFSLLADPRYPNCYGDFAYLDEVMHAGEIQILSARLQSLFKTHAGAANKLMYGSDWHMLLMELASETYLHAFEDVFSGSLAPFRNGFFEENARRFLKLAH